jgi:phospholipid transport system transporter-binding protein
MSERNPDAAVGFDGGFAPDHHGARWSYIGPLTFANAGPVLAAAAGVALPAEGEVDLENMAAIDSSAVAVLLALKRRAEGEGKPLRFTRVPAALSSLADVSGVDSILAEPIAK